MLRIAVDAMGGDHAPHEIVAGAAAALRTNSKMNIKLVGKPELLQPLLAAMDADLQHRMSVEAAQEIIGNEEAPAMAVRRKKDASIVVATRLLRDGQADALVTAGSTGAFMAAGLLILGRLPEIARPALAPLLPSTKGQGFLLLDVGANMDATPSHLLQYAAMGAIYMEEMLDRPNSKVALLNVGTEAGKGNELAKAAYELFQDQDSFDFIGNIEARNLLAGEADVIVADGFVGNVTLKLIEGVASSLFFMLGEEFTASLRNKLGAGLLYPSLRRLKRSLDYSEYGGAPLLGVKGAMVKCHGSSKSLAIQNGLRQAARFVENDVVARIARQMQAMAKREAN